MLTKNSNFATQNKTYLSIYKDRNYNARTL